jgi:hypothetical protein
MTLQEQYQAWTFPNLNLFLKEEVIPKDLEPVFFSADVIAINDVEFTLLTIVPDSETFLELTNDDETVPDPFVPLLTKCYEQVVSLLTEDRYGLTQFFEYKHGQLDEDRTKALQRSQNSIRAIEAHSSSFITNLRSVFELSITKQYQNLADYNQQSISNVTDLFANMISCNLTVYNGVGDAPLKRGYTDNFVSFDALTYSENASLSQKMTLTPIQHLSFYRLMWAVDAIQKIKYSVISHYTTAIILDNIDLQNRMLVRTYMNSHFNGSSLSVFDVSPQLIPNVNRFKFRTYMQYNVYKTRITHHLVGDGEEDSWIDVDTNVFAKDEEYLLFKYLFMKGLDDQVMTQ